MVLGFHIALAHDRIRYSKLRHNLEVFKHLLLLLVEGLYLSQRLLLLALLSLASGHGPTMQMVFLRKFLNLGRHDLNNVSIRFESVLVTLLLALLDEFKSFLQLLVLVGCASVLNPIRPLAQLVKFLFLLLFFLDVFPKLCFISKWRLPLDLKLHRIWVLL